MQDDGEKTRVRVALREIYARAGAEVEARDQLFCGLSGRCCRFGEAGHQLFLTRLEYEEMVGRGGPRRADAARCPWLERGLCGNRDGRALACRTYFCSDESAAAEVTEPFHAEIRRLHDEAKIPYEYRSLLDFMNSGPPVASNRS